MVTGAAGGITSAIVADLAAASGGTFYLLDLVAEPSRTDPKIALIRQDRERLKLALIEEAKAKGERPTPVTIDRQIMAIERSDAALRAVESVEAVGGKALWRSANLLDGPAITAIVEGIRKTHGRIDVLVHAGGIEISRKLSEKEAREFDLVFDIKADGFFSLLKAAEGMPIGATVVFSSVAGRFGNAGQTDYSAANNLLCAMSSALRRVAARDPHHRDRLDGLGRHRHGHARVDPHDHGRGRHLDAPAGVRHPDRPPRARGGRGLGRAGRRRHARHHGRGVRPDGRPGRREGAGGARRPEAAAADGGPREGRAALRRPRPSRRRSTRRSSRSSSTTRSTASPCCPA